MKFQNSIDNSVTKFIIITLVEIVVAFVSLQIGIKVLKASSNPQNNNVGEIILKSIASRRGICGVIFYLKLKNLRKTYILNSFETYSDKELLEIFNEFKKFKEEKIILDERLVIYRIQEKIEKCPFQ